MRRSPLLLLFLPLTATADGPKTPDKIKLEVNDIKLVVVESFASDKLQPIKDRRNGNTCGLERGISFAFAAQTQRQTKLALGKVMTNTAEKPLLLRYVDNRFPAPPPSSVALCVNSSDALTSSEAATFKQAMIAFSDKITTAALKEVVDVAVTSKPDGAIFRLEPGDPHYGKTATSNSTLHNLSLGAYTVNVTLQGYQSTKLELDLVSDPVNYNIDCVLANTGSTSTSTSKCTANRQ